MLPPLSKLAKPYSKLASIFSVYQSSINAYVLMALVSLFLTLTANLTFFKQVIQTYPLVSNMSDNLAFVISMSLVLLGLQLFLLVLTGFRYTLKLVIVFMLMVASGAGYFTDVYGTVYDTTMLQNAMQSDTAEAGDLMNIKFIARVLLLGALPSVLVVLSRVSYPNFKKNILVKIGTLLASLALVGLPIVAFGGKYASFFREHKPLRYYTNPITPIYSTTKLINIEYKKLTAPTETIMHASDAKQLTTPTERKPKLVVMVVGEAVRASNVSLAGYQRNTFPQVGKLMQSENLTYFNNMASCGTSTAYSVPCMFSYLGEKDYNVNEAGYHENVVDTLYNLGVNIKWRDNNSNSKGVMDRLPTELYSSYKSGENPNCSEHKNNTYNECRDVAMLVGLDEEIEKNTDNLLVIHQMGNHGPAYYKRYDDIFSKFTPVCTSNELANCERQTLVNGYDNAILSTDDLLSKTINWLKQHENDYDTAMLYASDHGESLGENSIYLHGLPKAFAPKEQYYIPALLWLGNNSTANAHIHSRDSNTKLNHDAVTPTLLKLFEVQTTAIEEEKAFVK